MVKPALSAATCSALSQAVRSTPDPLTTDTD
ncbi:hypothetical protein BGCPKDLD_5238 [Methylorubrum suomiense]|uniref:Uncharacterized protein n=1 Tax=Methylorubrum suomiense TaxID=144191 RepID=A0ABQ4V2W3_9HYPH|nr:hypothetical protein BGCPKDLD_5238 [Methylorubrum suomiense]